MAFVAGPRQVGKTTVCLSAAGGAAYLDWDNQDHRRLILRGPEAVAEYAGLNKLSRDKKAIIFDEIHKYGKWKNFLKGFFDVYSRRAKITVTGSSRLDIYKAGGDSLMGRYFLYRMHPLSIAEIVRPVASLKEITSPAAIPRRSLDKLLKFGGFPEPYIKNSRSFFNRWKNLRHHQIFNEEIRDLTRIQEISQARILADILTAQAGNIASYTNLASSVNVSVDTIRRWITTLTSLYFCFIVRPWARGIRKSITKEPKVYLWNWAEVTEEGFRLENFTASHLLKAVHYWTDTGLGDYGLYYLRDKSKREVDFLVTRDQKPWFLVEVKASQKRPLSEHLGYFQRQLNAPHAFQVVFDMPFVEQNCFAEKKPVIVPAQTLFSQLV